MELGLQLWLPGLEAATISEASCEGGAGSWDVLMKPRNIIEEYTWLTYSAKEVTFKLFGITYFVGKKSLNFYFMVLWLSKKSHMKGEPF